jgi:hypothetical protein
MERLRNVFSRNRHLVQPRTLLCTALFHGALHVVWHYKYIMYWAWEIEVWCRHVRWIFYLFITAPSVILGCHVSIAFDVGGKRSNPYVVRHICMFLIFKLSLDGSTHYFFWIVMVIIRIRRRFKSRNGPIGWWKWPLQVDGCVVVWVESRIYVWYVIVSHFQSGL